VPPVFPQTAMISPLRFRSASIMPTALLCLLRMAVAASFISSSSAAAQSTAAPPARLLLPRSPGGRSLQSCNYQEGALNTCAEAAMTDSEISTCGTCLSAYADASSPVSGSDCVAVNSFLCGGVSACPCISPCRAEYADYLECVLEARFAEEGADFTCDVDCGGGGGGGGSGSSTSGVGRRASSVLAFVVPALSGAVALAGAGWA
jgi:hypothetical protein